MKIKDQRQCVHNLIMGSKNDLHILSISFLSLIDNMFPNINCPVLYLQRITFHKATFRKTQFMRHGPMSMIVMYQAIAMK
jgi:hypothetical protein